MTANRVVPLAVALLAVTVTAAALSDEFMFGINTWSGKADPTEHVKALGVKWQAPFLNWNYVQPEIPPERIEITVEEVKANPAMVDEYIEACNWEPFDTKIRKLQEDGFSLFPIIAQLFTGTVPKLNGKPIIPHPPDTPVAFSDNPFQHQVTPIAPEYFLGHAYLHVRAVVRRYEDITHWMPDPEINQSALFRLFGGWKAGRCWSDWRFVTAALQTLTQAVKDECPDDKVCLVLNTDQPPAVTLTFGRNPVFAGLGASIMDWSGALTSWLKDENVHADLIGIDVFESQGTNDPHCYERLRKKIETAVQKASGRPVIIASLGCPSGPKELGWTETYQDTYLREAFRAAVHGGGQGFFYFNVQTPDRHGIAITPLDQKIVKRAFTIFKHAWESDENGFMDALTDSLFWLGEELKAAEDARYTLGYLRNHFFRVLETAESYWGLIRPDGTYKPAFLTLRAEFNAQRP